MKKQIFFLFALCAVIFSACSNDDDDKYIIPQLSPNTTNISFAAAGGSKEITVGNAEELNITTINEKDATSGKDTEVQKVKDPKNCTEAGWFSVKIEKVNDKYRKLVFTATANTGEAYRTKYVHVTCGGNIYGISFLVSQAKP